MVTASLNKRKPEFFYTTDVRRIRGQQYRWRLFMGWYGKIWENMGIYCRQHILHIRSHTFSYLSSGTQVFAARHHTVCHVLRIRGLWHTWAADAAGCCRRACPPPTLSHTLSYFPISIVRHTGVHLTIPYRMPSPSLGEVYAGINNKLWRHEVPGGVL